MKLVLIILCLGVLLFSACDMRYPGAPLPSHNEAGTSSRISFSATSGEESTAAASEAVSQEAPDSALPFDSPALWKSPHPDALVGNWHAGYMVGSMYGDRYVFEDTGTFYYSANQCLAGERLRYMDGEWSYADGVLHLVVMRKIFIEGGKVTDGWGSLISDIEGGAIAKIELHPNLYERLDYPVEIADFDDPDWIPSSPTDADELDKNLIHLRSIPSVLVGDIRFWKLSSAGYDDMPEQWESDTLYPYYFTS